MTDILDQFRDEELPPSRVDIHRAVRSGRRQRRIRTALGAGGAALAVAAAGLAVPGWLSHQVAPVPLSDACGSPHPARDSMLTWQRFDPLLIEIDASGVPGHSVVTVTTALTWQRVQLDSYTRREATVTLFACDGEPFVSNADGSPTPVDPTQGEPADPVAGAAAYWLPQDDPADPVALAWQWTPGAWAIVVPAEPVGPVESRPAWPRDELRAIARQIADGLALGVRKPVTAPIALPVPDGLYPVASMLHYNAGGLYAFPETTPYAFAIGFDVLGSDKPTARPLIWDFPDLTVSTSPINATADDRPEEAIPYPQDLGYPAYYEANPGGRYPDLLVLTVYEYSGFAVAIAPADLPGASSTDEKLTRAADIFRTIRAYPNAATDAAAWGAPIAP
jgi:hypothetical protein